MRTLSLILFLLLTVSLGGCSLLVGNIRPVEEKSVSYGVMDLSQANSEWVRLPHEETGSDPNAARELASNEISDIAYQTKKSASIISLTSACRKSTEQQEKDLKVMTQVLFMGFSDLNIHSQRSTDIQGNLALETIAQGHLHGEEMMMKTIVFRKASCVFDLVYMARPKAFAQNEQDFAHFVASIRLK